MATLILKIIVVILIADYLLERLLDYLNASRRTAQLPAELEGIYDAEKYRQAMDYDREKSRLSLISSSLSLAAMLFMLLSGGFAWLDQLWRNYTDSPVWLAVLFFGSLGLAADLLFTPVAVYRTFVLEEKYGFNKTTPRTFIFDKLKGWLLGALIGGGLLALITWIYTVTEDHFWLYAWAAIGGFTIFMTMFYSDLIVPLFNKQTPLEEGPLRGKIEAFARKAGFKIKNIYVMDGSKRSTKANAYFTGFGARKRIVLFDTLIRDHTEDELVSILAHEIGHYKKHHIITGMVLSLLQTGLMLFLMNYFLTWPELSLALGATEPSFHLGLLSFALIYGPFSMILGLLMNMISRRNEFAADRFAALNAGAASLKEALKKLSVNHLSNLTPHPAYVFFYYSHPPLLERLKALDEVA
ncbi:MAG: M48 family metallopeptidase [Bacteroidales bacterium]